ncbi:MAG: hypothetical protein F4210_05820 [Holophagales bacterium]|nr:hypothetical protein [Holophagales bacterium]
MSIVLMQKLGPAIRHGRSALKVALATLLLGTACHYVDPQCMAADLGISGRRAHDWVLVLRMNLPYKRYTESIVLDVNGAGGVVYTELNLGDTTTCRRMNEDEMQGLARFWSSETLGMSMPRCGSGYVFHQRGDRRACRESWPGLADRSLTFRPYASFEYDRPNEERIVFAWDLESPLPEDLERAFTGTLGLLCAEGRRLTRNLRRSMPELAAKAGC